MKNGENAAMPISAITYWMFFPRRLSGRPAQVARSPDIRSSIVPTRRLNQTRPDLQIARMLPIQSVAPPTQSHAPAKMRIAGLLAGTLTTAECLALNVLGVDNKWLR